MNTREPDPHPSVCPAAVSDGEAIPPEGRGSGSSLPKPYYQDGAVTIYHGDCLQIMRRLNHDIDFVLSDLPYGTTRCKWDSVLNLYRFWEVLNDNRINLAVLFAQTPFDKVLGASNLEGLRYEWIWEKAQATGHLNAQKMPMKAHENILVFYGQLPIFNPIKTQGHERKTAIRNLDRSELYGKQKPSAYDSTERYPRSVLQFASDKQTSALHPTQKPVALCEYLIATYSNPGATVLDCCAGSGTTGRAAKNIGRKAVLIEKEEKYCEISALRMSQEVLAL